MEERDGMEEESSPKKWESSPNGIHVELPGLGGWGFRARSRGSVTRRCQYWWEMLADDEK